MLLLLLFLDEQSVRNFLERRRLGKIDALLDNHCRGREAKLTGEEKDRLRQHVAENLYMDCALVIAYIQFEFGSSYSKSVPACGWILKGTDKELPSNCGRNIYGRAKEERCWAVMESVGNLVFQGGAGLEMKNSGHQNYTKITQALVDAVDEKNGTLCIAKGSIDKNVMPKTGRG